MKKIIPFLLALLIAISMIACNTESQDEVVSTDLTETEYTVQEEETEKSVEIVEYDLANFEIAFADNLSVDYAFSFQAKIKAATGLNIDVKRFKTQNEKSLFIFGQSDDAVSSKYYVDEYDTYYNHKGVLNNNGRFQVMGVDKLTVNASIDYFCNNVLTGGKTTFSAPTEGAVSEIITLESISLPERADESYLRIVSNNILLQSLDSSPERLYGLKAAFKFYDADIFGLQEVDDLWHTIGKLDVTMESLG